MAIACPRCNTPLSLRTATTTAGAAPVTADVCGACSGIWLDGTELERVSPVLGGLPWRVGEIASIAVTSGVACPRCRAPLGQIRLLDVPIDVCGGCSGVWLDGQEYEALSRAADRGDGLEAPPPAVPRPQIAEAQAAGTARCAACGAVVPLEKTYLTDVGLVCAGCYLSTEQQAMKERSEQGGSEFARQVRTAPDRPAARSVGRGNDVTGAQVAGFAFSLLGALLDTGRCSRCGCRHGSRCGHG